MKNFVVFFWGGYPIYVKNHKPQKLIRIKSICHLKDNGFNMTGLQIIIKRSQF